jgi:hypothetical protein
METREEMFERWWNRGTELGASHMIVVCDTFDHSDYPVYVQPGEDVRKAYDDYNGKNMQRVMEVYSYSRSKESQFAEHRAMHFD